MADHIQIGATAPRIQYLADGVQTVFPYPFPIFQVADLEIYLGQVKQSAGYTVSGAGNSGGGNVTFAIAPAASTGVTLRRRLPVKRVTDFQDGGAIRAKTLNDELDYQTAAIQQIADDVSRCIQRDPSSPSSANLTLPEPVAGRALKWDATGSALVMSDYDPDEQAASAESTLATAIAARATAEARAAEAAAAAITAQEAVAGVLPKVNVKSFGAKGDGRRVTDAVVTNGSNLVTSATASFTAADVGKKIQVYATTTRFDIAGRDGTWAGTVLRGTVIAVLSATEAQVSNAATATLAGATCRWGTDDYDAFVAALAALKARGGGVLYCPAGEYWLRTRLIIDFGSVSVRGDGIGATTIKQDYTGYAPNSYPWGGWDAIKIVPIPGGSSSGEMTAYDILKGAFGKQHYLRNVSVKDICIDGDRFYFDAAHQNTSGNGIGGHGINVKHCIGVDISGVLVVDAVRVGVFVQGVESVSITGNKIFDCAEQAMQAVGMRSFVISGNEMRGTLYAGIQMQLTGIDLEPDAAHAEYPHIKDGVVTGNTITDCRYAIAVLSMSNVTTASATATWAAGTAYSAGAVVQKGGLLYMACAASTGQDPALDAAHDYWVSFAENVNENVAITGNRIAQSFPGNEGQGIWVGKYSTKYTKNITVIGNTIEYNNQHDGGVVFYGVQNSTIASNTIKALGSATKSAVTLRGCRHVSVDGNGIASLSTSISAGILSAGGGLEGDAISKGIVIRGNVIDLPITAILQMAAISIAGAGQGNGHADVIISGNYCKGGIALTGNDFPASSANVIVSNNRVVTGDPLTHIALRIDRGVNYCDISNNMFSGQVALAKNGSNFCTVGTTFSYNRWLDGATGYDFGALTVTEQRGIARYIEVMETSQWASAPTSSTATGRPGEMRLIGGIHYHCYGKDQWAKSTYTTTF